MRGQSNFFRLGAINLIAIILIGLFSSLGETSKKEKKEHETTPIKETKVSFHEHLHAAKERKKRSELLFPSLISYIVAIIIFFIFKTDGASQEIILIFAVIIGFVVFILMTLLFKHRINKRFRALVGTKIYLVLLIISLVFTAYDYYQVHKDYSASFQDYLAQNFLGQEMIPTDGYVFTGE